MTLFEALILGIVEGITEFLPISSTGHLILASHLLGIESSPFLKSFEVIIQLGAILAVVILYFPLLLKARELTKNIFLAFLPTAIVGLALYSFIKTYLLGNTALVAVSLVIGGIAILIFENWYKNKAPSLHEVAALSTEASLKVGLFQILALIPGVSRSAATALGGMAQGLDRKTALEFSFLLSIPTMLAATGLDIVKNFTEIAGSGNLPALGVGFFSAFIVAMLSIKWLLAFVQTQTFRSFAWYRIAIGILFLVFVL